MTEVFDSWVGLCEDAGSTCSTALPTGTVDLTARFRPLVTGSATITLDPSDLGFGLGFRAVLVSEDGGAFVAAMVKPGAQLGGATIGTPNDEQITLLARFGEDGGVVWTSSLPRRLPDAGEDLIVVQQLREARGRLIGAGQCAAPGRGCVSPGLSLLEVDPATGTTGELRRLPIPLLPLPATRFPELSPCWIGIRDKLIDVCNGLQSPLIVSLPFTVGGCIDRGESLDCAAVWSTAWSYGGCMGPSSVGSVSPGLLELRPTIAGCANLRAGAALSSSSLSLVHSYFDVGRSQALLATFVGDTALPWGGTTGSGQQLLLVGSDGQRQLVSAPSNSVGGSVGFQTRSGGVVVVWPVQTTTVFGAAVMSEQLVYARLDSRLQVRGLILFDHIADFAVDSRGGRTALLLRGNSVTMNGTALSASNEQLLHLLLLAE